ncbi:Ig-like domain-containing protein [Pseudomonas sp. P66]|uniref:Ig-like domain-containing protein n=2 Tax=Pseudomonas arcuscaelestis TaxID=2710591 RepID=A0ABS2BYN5_9PSED|nr:Ig-like domain-containing protein [Pseudomonas arcuscaelestis]
MPINIVLAAAPPSIPANGSMTTITATLTDHYGVSIGAGTQVHWQTTLGTLDAPTTETDEDGVATVHLKSVPVIANATVTATSSEGGLATILIPFSDYWVAIASVYTAWANNGAPYNCSAWSPAANTVAAGTSFTQSASCNQAQIAYRQDRQQSPITGAIRNVGGPVPLSQVINVTATHSTVGTMPPPKPTTPWSECKFDMEWHGMTFSGQYFWVVSGYDFDSVVWDTAGMAPTAWVPAGTTKVTVDGVTYYRGDWVQTQDGARQHQICR